jgi:PAS domain S-box-containing protein
MEWAYQRLAEGVIIQKLVQELPETERQRLGVSATQSMLVLPVFTGNQLWGFIRFESGKTAKVWTETEQNLLTNLAGTLGAAIARNQVEQELFNTRNYLNNIINTIPASVFVKEKNHRFILVNDACCELNGLSREEILGKTDFDIYPETTAAQFREKEEVVFRLGQTSITEEAIVLPDKMIRTVITRKATFKNEYGESYLVGCNLDITEQKQVEKALLKEKFLVQSLMKYTPDYIYFKDVQGRFIQVSKSMTDRLGLAEVSQLNGKTDFDIFDRKHAQEAFDTEQQIIRTGIPVHNLEEQQTWPDGIVCWVSSTKMPLFDGDGQIKGTFGISRNITANKEAERELINSKNYLHHIFETVPVPIFVKDGDHRWVFLNQAWLQFTGVDKNEFLGKSDYDLHPKAEADLFWERDQIIFDTGQETIYEELLTNKNGQIRKVITKKTRFRDEYGNDFLVGTIMDVTEIKRYEARLVHYHNYLNAIINSLSDPIFVKDRTYRLVLVNDACCTLFGQSREKLLNKTLHEVLLTEQAYLTQAHDERAFQSRQTTEREECIQFGENTFRTFLEKKTCFTNELQEYFLVVSLMEITDRKKGEVALAAKEKYYRSLIQYSTDVITILEKDGTARYQSPSFYHILGHTESRIIGKNVLDFIHPDDIPEVLLRFQTILEQPGVPTTIKYRFLKDSGEWALLESVGINWLDIETIGGVVVNSRDITERKKSEVALMAKEKYFRSLIQYSTDMIVVVEPEGKLLYLSPASMQTFGYQESELLGTCIFEYLHPDDIRQAKEVFNQILQQPGMPVVSEYRVRKSNGEWATVESIGTNWLHDAAICGVVINSRDISERKKTEAEIRDQSQILHAILSNMPVAVFKTDREGNYTQTMGALIAQMSLEKSGAIGLNLFTEHPAVREELMNVAAEGLVSFTSSIVVNGRDWYLDNYLFKDQSPAGGFIGFAIDITSTKVSEQKLQEYAHDLEKINKELDQFAYIVSHDLKAPLRAIANLSQWIEEDLGTDISDDIKSNMELLRGRVNRMQSLISGILEYSKVNRTKASYEEVDVAVLLQEVQSVLDIPATHPVILQTEMPLLLSNRTRLEQVFSNLISNAYKYHDKPAGHIRIAYQEMKDVHQFSVSDDGPGIAPEYHEKIFIIFQTLQAKDKLESTGVGLAIVKKIIEEQGGKIWVESQPGEGSTFLFTLPKQYKHNI